MSLIRQGPDAASGWRVRVLRAGWLAWLYLRIWAGPGRVRSAPRVCLCLPPPPPPAAVWAELRLGRARARLHPAAPAAAAGLTADCAGCLARSLSAGPGHCPPDTRLACDVILPQLESAPCLQQTRASHEPVACDPTCSLQPDTERCSRLQHCSISWTRVTRGCNPTPGPDTVSTTL